ncbi:tetratricopeptide repeat protein [Rhodoferax sp.]|uniref:tetratricopeptide repeat protein n=1 Tax=Rhodoferax sp. TaxID=50421 RepID=UPI00277ACD9E|nr:tetratricopeptide repeat protein [Rhodoferax sp.]
MSLLLDALNRASKDKAAAASAQAPSPSKPDEPPLTSTVPAPEPTATLPPIRSEPASTTPVLELSLSPNAEPPTQVDAWHTEKAVATPDKPLMAPFVLTEHSQATKPPQVPPTPVPLPAAPTPPAASSTQPKAQAAPRVAQDIVRAKTPAARAKPPLRLVILGSLALMLSAGLGSVLMGWWGDPSTWLQTSGLAGSSSVAPTVAARLEPAAPVPVGVESAAVPASAAVLASAPPTPPTLSAQPPVRVAAVRAQALADAQPRQAPAPARSAAPPLAGQTMVQSRTAGPSTLELGYAALVEGRLPAAAQAYGQALLVNPEERDALLGLAYIAHQQGRVEEARGYYQRVLRQDPGNPVARSGLLAVTVVDDPQAVASRSREVAEQNPDSGAAQSALGHAMVREGRLADAQQLFYRAHLLEPGVAQHAFNLAVALDRLHKFDPARVYYERALALSTRSGGERSSGVPQSVVQTRLEQLRAAKVTKPLEVAHE